MIQTQKKYSDYLQEVKNILKDTNVEISNKSNIPLRTVQRQVKELKDKNLIEYKGSKKTGGYYAK